MIHTANWPKDYKEEQWKNDRVAVIGSGASSIQTVPTMQPHTKHIDVFVRVSFLAPNAHMTLGWLWALPAHTTIVIAKVN